MTQEMFLAGIGVLIVLSNGTLLGWKAIEKRADRKNGPQNGKPGSGGICRENTKFVTEHEIIVKHLATAVVDGKTEREVIRSENRKDHKDLFNKIEELRKEKK